MLPSDRTTQHRTCSRSSVNAATAQRGPALPSCLSLAQVARSLAASQAGVNGAGGAKSLAAAISASAELRLPDELAARAQRQLKICVPQASPTAWSLPSARVLSGFRITLHLQPNLECT